MVQPRVWMLAIGAMDALTGLLLIFDPLGTVALMGIAQPVSEPVFLSWIGAFVFAVGSSYALPFLPGRPERQAVDLRACLRWTGWARFVIGLFVLVQILLGRLVWGWLTVAVVDLGVALVQYLWLRRNP